MQKEMVFICACGIFALLVLIQKIVKSKHPVRCTVGGIITGFFALAAVNLTGSFTGVNLPLSPLTLGVSGVAGIPGVTVLLLLNLIFQ